MTKTLAAIAAAVAALTGAGQAAAQQSNADIVLAQIADEVVRRASYAPSNQGNMLYRADLALLGAGSDWTLQILPAGDGARVITVTGFCDVNCSDLDLYVTDDLGREVASDVLINDTPVVSWYVDSRRAYTLRARMYSCALNTCYYGVAAFFR